MKGTVKSDVHNAGSEKDIYFKSFVCSAVYVES
jgi:hypothetical protein